MEYSLFGYLFEIDIVNTLASSAGLLLSEGKVQ